MKLFVIYNFKYLFLFHKPMPTRNEGQAPSKPNRINEPLKIEFFQLTY